MQQAGAEPGFPGVGAEGAVVSAMTLHVRSDQCHLRGGACDRWRGALNI